MSNSDKVKERIRSTYGIDLDKLGKEEETNTTNNPEEIKEGEDREENESGAGHVKLLELLYSAKESIHLTHNTQRSKDASIHTTLGSLYGEFEGMIDGLVEAVFGIYGTSELSFTAESFADPIEYLKKLYEEIEVERKFYKESWIQNEVDVFQKEIALALYKLRYVKSEPNK